MKLNALVTFVVAALFAAGCAVPPPPSKADAPPVSVTVGRAQTADLPSVVEAGGIVRARSTAVIASRVMAPIIDVQWPRSTRHGGRPRRLHQIRARRKPPCTWPA